MLLDLNAIPSKQHLGGSTPYVFTEYGLLQLANVLRSEKANLVSIRIVELFVELREALNNNQSLMAELDELRQAQTDQGHKIEAILEYLNQFEQAKQEADAQANRPQIGFKRNDEDEEDPDMPF